MSKKTCICGNACGPRTLVCKCGHKFETAKVHKEVKAVEEVKPKAKRKRLFKNRRTPSFVKIDWKNLVSGDMIRARGGPIYKGEENKIAMGYCGIFKVIELHKDAILARDHKFGGYSRLYMGPRRYCKETGLYMRPHQIIKKVVAA